MALARAAGPPPAGEWYRYDSFGNLKILCRLLGLSYDLGPLVGDLPIADVGTGDGDLAFTFESFDCRVHAYDHAPTNINGMSGIRALIERRRSAVEAFELDVDQEPFPRGREYGLALVLGLLYHLKNPFGALERVRACARHCILSTRIARTTPDHATRLESSPLAYLLAPDECNHDATNYWIFSFDGLQRLAERTGWRVVKSLRRGALRDSDPVARDERAFLLLARA